MLIELSMIPHTSMFDNVLPTFWTTYHFENIEYHVTYDYRLLYILTEH